MAATWSSDTVQYDADNTSFTIFATKTGSPTIRLNGQVSDPDDSGTLLFLENIYNLLANDGWDVILTAAGMATKNLEIS